MTYEIQDGCRWCICIVHRKNSSFEFTAATAYDAIRSQSLLGCSDANSRSTVSPKLHSIVPIRHLRTILTVSDD